MKKEAWVIAAIIAFVPGASGASTDSSWPRIKLWHSDLERIGEAINRPELGARFAYLQVGIARDDEEGEDIYRTSTGKWIPLTDGFECLNEMLGVEIKTREEAVKLLNRTFALVLRSTMGGATVIDGPYIRYWTQMSPAAGRLRPMLDRYMSPSAAIVLGTDWTLDFNIILSSGGIEHWRASGRVFPLQIRMFLREFAEPAGTIADGHLSTGPAPLPVPGHAKPWPAVYLTTAAGTLGPLFPRGELALLTIKVDPSSPKFERYSYESSAGRWVRLGGPLEDINNPLRENIDTKGAAATFLNQHLARMLLLMTAPAGSQLIDREFVELYEKAMPGGSAAVLERYQSEGRPATEGNDWTLEYNVALPEGGIEHCRIVGKLFPLQVSLFSRAIVEPDGAYAPLAVSP